MAGKSFCCVVAMDTKRGIGKDGKLPWRLKGDMQFFKELTSKVKTEGKQNAVLMGRKTWESIPKKFRPLRGRVNIVLSRMLKTPPDGVHHMCSSLENALDLVTKEPLASKIDTVFVIGGAAVYKVAMEHKSCSKLYVTEIYHEFECDVFYPNFDKNIYQPSSDENVSSEIQDENGVTYKFCMYERK